VGEIDLLLSFFGETDRRRGDPFPPFPRTGDRRLRDRAEDAEDDVAELVELPLLVLADELDDDELPDRDLRTIAAKK
uniref:Uncharacterized protein n=1 Tax=Panagrolaimus sp. ES5 TaxID=591445 RepID=A0AC34GKN0_9BILA